MRRATDRLDTAMDALAIIMAAHKQEVKTLRTSALDDEQRLERCIECLRDVIGTIPNFNPDAALRKRIMDFVDLDA